MRFIAEKMEEKIGEKRSNYRVFKNKKKQINVYSFTLFGSEGTSSSIRLSFLVALGPLGRVTQVGKDKKTNCSFPSSCILTYADALDLQLSAIIRQLS